MAFNPNIFTNSDLATIRLLSPSRSAPRNQPIRKITWHHTAGVLRAQTIANIQQSSGSSYNYGVGNDRQIALIVEERNRCWGTSSAINDNEAVVLGISNSAMGGDWPVDDEVIARSIILSTDICWRNGIQKLIWTGGRDGTLTTHDMFAATACPGTYLRRRMPDICREINLNLVEYRFGETLWEGRTYKI